MALPLSATALMLINLARANPLPAPPIPEIYIRSYGTVDSATAPIQQNLSLLRLLRLLLERQWL